MHIDLALDESVSVYSFSPASRVALCFILCPICLSFLLWVAVSVLAREGWCLGRANDWLCCRSFCFVGDSVHTSDLSFDSAASLAVRGHQCDAGFSFVAKVFRIAPYKKRMGKDQCREAGQDSSEWLSTPSATCSSVKLESNTGITKI